MSFLKITHICPRLLQHCSHSIHSLRVCLRTAVVISFQQSGNLFVNALLKLIRVLGIALSDAGGVQIPVVFQRII